ncbi:MAG: hypothetical protein EOO53_16485 [Gammaproteobacteria bacterium]|nr:MAG: hypothetical protein EOO53_16485 [Gammaproteobacteria bacterium]
MLSSLLLAAALWPSAVTQNCKPLDNSIMVGVAQSPSATHLYCELVSQPNAASLEVSYVFNDKQIAEKKINYGASSTKPSIAQKDFRFGEIRTADVSAKNVELQYQENAQKKPGSVTILLEKVDVVDAGFDYFVRDHWDELRSGKTLSVNFASMAHLKALPLRISAQPLEKCSNNNEKNSQLFCFFVEIDNAILRMLLGNIKLTYDEQHRLYEFNGVVNILGGNQDNQKAVIRYFYGSDYQPADK